MTPFDKSDILYQDANTFMNPSYCWPHLCHFHFYKKEDYEGSQPPWWWKFKVTNWTVRCWHSIYDYVHLDIWRDWLGRSFHWRKNCSPSFVEAFSRLYTNVMQVLTPWYGLRRRFIAAWYNYNGSKLLDDGLDFGYVRTRDNPECNYYEIKFFGPHYKMTKTVFRDPNGESVNGFLTGICIAFSDKSDEEKQKEAEAIREEKSTVCTGWVFTPSQAARELNKIVALTPDLHWWNRRDDIEVREPTNAEIKIEGDTNDGQ